MHFKLSVRELEILDKDRIKILKKLRESHLRDSSRKSSKWSRKKPMKPPILVVPLDDSRLFCIIQTCNDYDDQNEVDEEGVHNTEKEISTSKQCCKQSIRRKQSRKLLEENVTKAKSNTNEDNCSANKIQRTEENVPKEYDHILSASIEQSEVYNKLPLSVI